MQTSYEAKVRDRFMKYTFPSITVDDYIAALEDTAAMEAIEKQIKAKEFPCTAFLYKDGAKSSTTIHPPSAGKSRKEK